MTSERHRTRHTLASDLSPFEAYRLLAAHQPLLLESRTAHPDAKRSYVAINPVAELRVGAGHVTLQDADGERHLTGDPLAVVDRLVAPVPVAGPSPGPGIFAGGWAGLFTYEFTRHIEPTLPIPEAPTEAILRRYLDVIVFDDEVTLWSTSEPGHDDVDGRARSIRAALGASPTDLRPVRKGTWTPSMGEGDFTAAVETLRRHVAEGDLFQANLATRFTAQTDARLIDLYAGLREANPGPFMALMSWPGGGLASTSPELLFACTGERIYSRPIAGTRPRRSDPDQDRAMEEELLQDEKEQAEHTMLVDLVRNDIAKVAQPGTVDVPERGSVERYRRVMHLVSRVEGRRREGVGFADVLSALFPGGTITGAPKHRACLRIAEAEPVARGPYTGSVGWIGFNGDACWNILIRSLVQQDGRVHVHAGSGIVADSDPAREWQEAQHKAAALLEMHDSGAGVTHGVGTVMAHGAWQPPRPPGQVDARVLIVDNYDSFVHNLADYCAALGAKVSVIRNDEDWAGALAASQATHLILSPGPGRPEDAGYLLDLCRHALGRIPVLGVCLGHQALALASGGSVEVGTPVHGKTATIEHATCALLGEAGSFTAGRYHSLVVAEAPAGWRRTAWTRDGVFMAMEHDSGRAFGVQFHPESIITQQGHEILLRFLQTQ